MERHGRNHTWAGKMHGAVVILVDADEEVIQRRIEKNYMDMMVRSLDEAIAIAKEHLEKMSQSPSVLSETQQMFMKRLLLRTSFRTLLQKCVLAMTRFPISHQDTQELRLIRGEDRAILSST